MLYLASNSEMEDVTPWDLQIQQSSQKFLQAEEVFLSPASGVPSVSSLVASMRKDGVYGPLRRLPVIKLP